jgi:hypothetical protein
MTAAGAVLWTVIALGTPPQQPPSSQGQAPPATGLVVGRVVDAASGRPIAGAIVSLNGAGVPVSGGPNASRQPRAMTNASGLSRRIMNARTANDGSFTFRNTPPGEYYLAAVDDVEPGEWYDPSFLQRLVTGAIKVTIAEGEKKVQDLKVGGG